eukprot:CAMPEP_0172038686 /NCGR_PEP_ID=MMETSP1041-20130122/23460_1 /TAXON_ID=464988 /ORGANISM="Hemiselmis andersenii, Strain CCMP439" /LENGTH=71 /DNA_ID=CAMNT_0012696259 /DNA_START=68 /DNA_END=280 /DNA_ORIENTATION=-
MTLGHVTRNCSVCHVTTGENKEWTENSERANIKRSAQASRTKCITWTGQGSQMGRPAMRGRRAMQVSMSSY